MRKQLFYSILIALVGINSAIASPASAGQGIAYYKAGFPQVAKPLLISEVSTNPATLSETCYFLGNIYFIENQLDSAKFYFEKGNKANPMVSLSSIGLSMLKIKSDPATADAEYKAILKLKQNKKNVDVLIAIGYAYLYNDIIDIAQIYADRAKAMKSKYAPTFVLYGDIEFAKKNIGESCKYYDQAIYFDKKSKEGFIKYARAYKSVNSDLAIQKLTELKAQEPGFLLVDREMADIYYATNKYDKAAELYKNYLESGNSNIKDLTQYAFTLFLAGKFEESLKVAKMGIEKSQRDAALNRIAMFNCVEMKSNTDALYYADQLINKSENPKFTYLDFRYYGQAYRNIDSLSLAIPMYEKALTFDSTKTDLYKDISEMYEAKKQYKKSVDAYLNYKKSVTDEKKFIDTDYKLGRLLYNVGIADTTLNQLAKTAALKSADSLFTIVAAAEETNYRGNYWRARTNAVLDPEVKTDVAKNLYDKTAALCEAKADSRYNEVIVECYRYSAIYYVQRNDNVSSKKYLNKMLELDPKNTFAKNALSAIAADEKNAKERAAKAAARAAAKAAANAQQ